MDNLMKSFLSGMLAFAIFFLCTACSVEQPPAIAELKDYPREVHTVLADTILRDYNGKFPPSEYTASGHIILGNEEKAGDVYFYLLASYGVYADKDGELTKLAGIDAMPAVVVVSADEQGVMTARGSYPRDTEEIRAVFPRQFTDRVTDIGKNDIDTLAILEMQNVISQCEKNKPITE